jgi:hypothetical protein
MEIIESDGKFAAIDTGGRDQWEMISRKLNELNVRRLEFILLTHFHQDHYGCLKLILENYEVGTVYFKRFSGAVKTDGKGDVASKDYCEAEMKNCLELEAECAAHSKLVYTDDLQSIDFCGTEIKLFYGENTVKRVFEDKSGECCGQYICNENQNSLMAYFTVNGRTVLMSGDITDFEMPHPAISMMNTRAARIINHTVDIYKVPHHGYGVGSDEALAIYRPRYNVITNSDSFIKGKLDSEERIMKANSDAEIFYMGDGGIDFDISDSGEITYTRYPR